MSLPNLFSRRKRLQDSSVQDVYVYDVLPPKVRVQIVHLWNGSIGNYYAGYDGPKPSVVYDGIVDLLRREFGVFQLYPKRSSHNQDDLSQWFLEETDIDKCLDAIELSFGIIDEYVRDNRYHFSGLVTISPDQAILELNARLLESSIGYQYERGEIVKLDSLLIHKEVMIPALTLLSESEFQGANSEFREAHRLYRSGDYELCLTECCKSFESVIKIIAAKRNWGVEENDTAARLVSAIFENELLPSHVSSGFSALRSLLESAIPPIRNKTSGHGRGAIARVIPQYMASFQLAQTAAAIVFLVQAHKDKPLPVRAGGRPALAR